MWTLFWLSLVSSGGTLDELPEQVKLAWTETQGEISVTWVTFTQSQPYLRIRPITSSDYNLFKGTSTQFEQGQGKYQWVHRAMATGLKDTQEYQYFVGEYPLISQIYQFIFRESTSVKSIAAFGDLGVGPGGKLSLNHMQKLVDSGKLQGIFLFGDIAYDLNDDFGFLGDDFLREIAPITQKIPFMVVPGNHDNYKNFTQVINRFSMIKNQANQGTGLFFSIDTQYAHIIMLNMQNYFYYQDDNSPMLTQYNWLVEDLEKANKNREERPWLVVMGHRPLYCSEDSGTCHSEAQYLQNQLEDLFYNNTVDLYLAGHAHYYERDTAIYKNVSVSNGGKEKNRLEDAGASVYILSGIAGSNEGPNPVPSEQAEWCEYMENKYGYGTVEFFNKTTLLWTQYDAENGVVADYLYLSKSSARPFPKNK